MRPESRRSRTAEGVAALRAAGALERDPARRNPDHLARRFIGPWYAFSLAWAPLRTAVLRGVDRRLPGIYGFLTARTRRIDEVLLAELRAGVEQLIIIGAGADTRAYRFKDQLRGVHVVELDHPSTQKWKQARLRRIFGALPTHVRYVPMDLDDASPSMALDRAGVARTASTFFICEGVMPYLREDAVDAVLTTVPGFGPGSSIVFDYLYADHLARTSEEDAAKYLRYLRRRDEPLVSGFDPDRLRDALAARALTLVSHLKPTELLSGYAGGTGTMHSFAAVAHARCDVTTTASAPCT